MLKILFRGHMFLLILMMKKMLKRFNEQLKITQTKFRVKKKQSREKVISYMLNKKTMMIDGQLD